MTYSFAKYSGAGNDFLLFDHRHSSISLESPLVKALCARRTGVGADGLIEVLPSASADYRIRFYNADGSEAEMCGNGLRCAARFLHDTTPHEEKWKLETVERMHEAWISGADVTITMGAPVDIRKSLFIPTELGTVRGHYLNTGVPHVVLFVKNVEAAALDRLGPILRHHPLFSPSGTNVNVVERHSDGGLRLRTYERGVEAETLACGTGATAAAIAAHLVHETGSPTAVQVASKDILTVRFDPYTLEQVTLTGPASRVYTGQLDPSRWAIPAVSIPAAGSY